MKKYWITYLNDKNFRPGVGFNFLKQEITNNSAFIPSKEINYNSLNAYNIINMHQTYTEENFKHATNQIYELKDKSKTECKMKFIKSLADLHSFFDINGMTSIMIVNKDFNNPYPFLCDIEFYDDKHSLFIMINSKTVDWKFNISNFYLSPDYTSIRDFLSKYGDTFVSCVSFGKTSMYRIDFEKNEYPNFVDLENNIKDFFDGSSQIAFTSSSFKIKVIKGMNIDNDLKHLHKYLKTHDKLAQKFPEIMHTKLESYESVGFCKLPYSINDTLQEINQKLVPRYLDLLQTKMYIENIINFAQPQDAQGIDLLNKTKSSYNLLNSAISTFNVWIEKLYNNSVKKIDIPPVEKIIDSYILNQSSTFFNKVSLYRKSITEESKHSLSAPVDTKTMRYKYNIALYTELMTHFQTANKKDGEVVGVPTDFVHLSKSSDSYNLFVKKDSYGFGIVVYRIPENVDEWESILASLINNNDKVFIQHLQIDNSKFEAKNAFKNWMKNDNTNTKKAVSKFTNEKFMIHPKINMTDFPKIIDILKNHFTTEEYEKKLIEIQNHLKNKDECEKRIKEAVKKSLEPLLKDIYPNYVISFKCLITTNFIEELIKSIELGMLSIGHSREYIHLKNELERILLNVKDYHLTINIICNILNEIKIKSNSDLTFSKSAEEKQEMHNNIDEIYWGLKNYTNGIKENLKINVMSKIDIEYES